MVLVHFRAIKLSSAGAHCSQQATSSRAMAGAASDTVIGDRKQRRHHMAQRGPRKGRQDGFISELTPQLASSDVTSWFCASQDIAEGEKLAAVTHK